MSSSKTSVTTRSANVQDLELFTTTATDPTPDRHPSILRPGGHASPLVYPTVLRPGAGRQANTPSPHANSKSPSQQSPFSPPPVAYKAYSPPKVQSPSDGLSAEIEGYFSNLEVAPLNIKKKRGEPEPSSAAPPLPPKREDLAEDDMHRRCASPPVPPKERFEEEHHVVPPIAELEAPTERIAEPSVVSPVSEPEVHMDEEGPSSEPPPAYDESERVTPPPEKAAQPCPSANESLAGSAAASAAQVGSSVAGVHATEAIEASSSNLAAAADKKEDKTSKISTGTPTAAVATASATVAPPSLPPRQEPSSKGKGKAPASQQPSPEGKGKAPAAQPSSLPSAKPAAQPHKAGGAAATSAAHVGAAVAGLGQNPGLIQARKVLEKHLGHMVDKAKEIQHQRQQFHQQMRERRHSHAKKPSTGKGKKKATESTSAPRGGAEDPYLAMKAEGDYLYV